MITINDKPLSDYGVMMLAGSYASLLTPPQMKEWVSNDNPRKNGVDYLPPNTTLVKERDVTLIFGIQGDTLSDFITKYNQFITLIQGGIIKIHIPDLERNYYLKYENCTSFDHCNLKACKIAVKFIEPDPTKRV